MDKNINSRQKETNNFWRDLINNPDLVNTERNWAGWVRVKFDALIEVGFNDDQALKIVISNLRSITNNINLKTGG